MNYVKEYLEVLIKILKFFGNSLVNKYESWEGMMDGLKYILFLLEKVLILVNKN